MSQLTKNKSKAKSSITESSNYHHGDLRQALITAARNLVLTQGPEQFSMADACKQAGVSKAAPYRHFKNKNDLLFALTEQAFTEMRLHIQEVSAGLILGSDKRISEIGLGYIAYAMKQPAIFKLMSGNSIQLNEEESLGRPTFQLLLDEIIARTNYRSIDKLMKLAFPLWTLVHGASMLIIDNSYKKIYPDANTELMIRETTKILMASHPEPTNTSPKTK
jgi:AcrR family transcriptional regulator